MDIDAIVKGRRSIRKYQPQEVSRQILEDILATALWAPSGSNRQDWEVIAVRGEKRDQLVAIVEGAKHHIQPNLEKLFPEKIIQLSMQFFKDLGGAPAVLLVYIPCKESQCETAQDKRGRFRPDVQHFDRLLSAAALIQNLLLTAHAHGLGTCWMVGPKYVEEKINDLFGMTDKELVSIIPIGYPDQTPPAPPRKEGVIRWEGF
ncbi:nitroreductase [Geothermobacter ehrlichii]|uniref:Nitroreductase n=1 Tax=Geothermobacter ehrlichii TaxID=213224 RepID=A0A5D3WJL9_9BACT|nr:nitroreductase family protein [Geothermobacter ehrlichii]TYO98404.1 nitroreductase [Geothermobacter ehrlichii]